MIQVIKEKQISRKMEEQQQGNRDQEQRMAREAEEQEQDQNLLTALYLINIIIKVWPNSEMAKQCKQCYTYMRHYLM